MNQPSRFTDRLRLEPIGPAFVEDLWLLHQDDGVAEWFHGKWSRARTLERAEVAARGWATDGVEKWMAYDRSTDDLVGRGGVSFVGLEHDDQKRLEVGWTLRDRYRGRGYATEIGRAGLAFAFDELRAEEVVSFTEPHNERSRAVMERLGMRFEREIIHLDAPFVLYTITRRR